MLRATESDFTPEELEVFHTEFDSFDRDGSGSIDTDELTSVLKNLGLRHDKALVEELIEEVDADKSGTIEFNEFLAVVTSVKMGMSGSMSKFAKVYEKQKEMIKVAGHSGLHSYSQEEMSAFAEHISQVLANDPELGYLLPIDPTGLELTVKVGDGVLLSKFINRCVNNTIDERAVNKRKGNKPLSVFQINENLNVVVSSAKSIGVQTINLGATELANGAEYPHLVLGLVWQLVKLELLNAINLKENPQLIRLLQDGEEMTDLLKLPPDQILLRWINFHLANAGSERRANNFGVDLKDSEIYTVLLNQIDGKVCDTEALAVDDLKERAAHVLRNAQNLGVQTFIKPNDIVSANTRLNLALCASIFNTNAGLDPLTEEEYHDLAGMMNDDVGDSREERAFRMWINTLGIKNLFIHDLFADCDDGLVLLRVMDFIEPGIVDWKKVEMNPNNRFKKLTNCNYAVDIGKEMKFSLVGIGGVDILSGNKKLILALVWQLMRYHTIKFLGQLQQEGKPVSEQEIVDWANGMVKKAGRPSKMTSFKDKSLTTSHFFFDLLYAVEHRIIDWDLVTDAADDEKKLLNARYAISIARKLNCTIFLLPEDIVEVKYKMIMTFVAAIMQVHTTGVSLD